MSKKKTEKDNPSGVSIVISIEAAAPKNITSRRKSDTRELIIDHLVFIANCFYPAARGIDAVTDGATVRATKQHG